MKSIATTLRRWRMQRILRRHPLPHDVWIEATQKIIALQGLDAAQLAHLRELATWFLHAKAINGVHGLEVTLPMRVAVAAQACLLILNLDTDYFDNWVEVILYPGAFRVNHEHMDEIGVVHREAEVRTGESWLRGPVILSWDDVEQDSYCHTGCNVVLHEFAHKLDGLDGATNGIPPLRNGMSRKHWADALSAAYDALCLQVDTGQTPCIDPYAASDPAEFFAVATEYFFIEPDILKGCYPEVYGQLKLFYTCPDLN